MEQLDPVRVQKYRDPTASPDEREAVLKVLIGQLVTALEQGYDVFAFGADGVTDIRRAFTGCP